MNFQKKLQMLAKRKSLRQIEVWKQLKHVIPNKATFGNYWNKDPRPRIDEALALARCFEVSLDYLADDTIEEEKTPPVPTAEELHFQEIVAKYGKKAIVHVFTGQDINERLGLVRKEPQAPGKVQTRRPDLPAAEE